MPQLWGFRTPPPSGEPPLFRLTHTLTKQDQQKNTPTRDPFYSELWRFRLRGGDSSLSPSQLYSLEEQPEKPPPAQTGISEKRVPPRSWSPRNRRGDYHGSTKGCEHTLGSAPARRGRLRSGFSTTDRAPPAAFQPGARSGTFRRAGELCQRHGLALWSQGAAPQLWPPRTVLR